MKPLKFNLFPSLVMAVAISFGLAACGGSSSTTPEPMPEPTPEPMPPSDLEVTQTEAAAAAMAAKAASDAAGASADGAEEATMNIATLQTGGMAKMHAVSARAAANKAMAAYMDAEAASEAAAAATTGDAAEAAWRMAENAKDAAEAAQAMAAEATMMAMEAAMTELHIDGTMKSVGDSSIDANMGMLTVTADDDSKTITGHQSDAMREMSGAVVGRAHTAPGTTPVLGYRQAVEARDLAIGKTLDTTDDKARVTVIHSRAAGSKKVRVYALEAPGDDFAIQTDSDGEKVRGTVSGGAFTAGADAAGADPGLNSVGMHHRATETTETGTDGDTYTYAAPTVDPLTPEDNALDPSDLVQAMTKAREVFSYVDLGDDDAIGGTGVNADTTRYVVETARTSVAGGSTTVSYQHVDTMAPAAPDGADANADLDLRVVTADLPMAEKYSHIHFGVWASLGEATKAGAQKLADLGIGWVQNISGSGMATNAGVGTATFNGDWVATIQRRNSTSAGSFTMDDGPAMLVANFGKGTVKGTLTGLATLDGDLTGSSFMGTKASNITHADLDSTGTFTGSFNGGIYGPDGSEAAGVFGFDGGAAGAFRGAFGGKDPSTE